MTVNLAQTRPQGYQTNNLQYIPNSFSDEAFQGVYDGNGNLIYKGFAIAGTSITAQAWQIAKLSYDGSNNLLSITWPLTPQGIPSNDYNFIWNNGVVSFLTYTYV